MILGNLQYLNDILQKRCNCIAQNIQNRVNCSVTDFNVIFIEIFYFRVYIRKNTYLVINRWYSYDNFEKG